METMQQLFFALWHQDYETLSNPSLLWAIYIMLFVILFLENGLLPAAFLPGDSLLILVGVLIAKDTLDFPTTLIVLTAGASLGCWVGYLQGRWLSNTKVVKSWLSHLPPHYHQRAHSLFHRHGLAALLVGRFLAFIRTLLPMLAGIAGLNSRRFQFFNWLSGFLWVGILTALGYGLGISPIFRKYEHHLMNILMLIPVVLLVCGLIASLWVVWKRKRTKPADDTHAQ
ncbi:DedA family protein (plasmid) [Morganella morganii]|uniref:DedA family protein n=1 Tax=Morganella morganii TaxID=582 RepID=A0A433ZQE5_MORMO|nr:DedA family protein [Morganella morganii]RUT64342.1 DedA family protein [Morganella morganii]